MGRVLLPSDQAAKRPDRSRAAASELAGLRVERAEPLIAVGGGALGDAAGFLAATYLRGVPFIQLPTTLVAQIDSSIGGKTGVDLPEGKNLVGAFHQPAAIVIDVDLLRTLPERQLRAALGEAAKMAVIGDERLFELLESDGAAIARADPASFEGGALAEVVERAGWAKVEIVSADERERRSRVRRINLNLGHSLGHAFEAAAGYGALLHGEAVAYGLRAAVRDRHGSRRHATRTGRADRAAARRAGAGRASRSPRSGRSRSTWLPTRKLTPAGSCAGCSRPPTGSSCATTSSPTWSSVRHRACWRPAAGARGDQGPRAPGARSQPRRKPQAGIYGTETLVDIHAGIAARAAELGLWVSFFQSNHEGALIDRLHQRDFDVAIVNAGGLTHTSVALRDALLAIQRPFIEVHLSDPSKREPFRQVNFLHDIALESIVGQGARGYHLALDSIARRFGGRGG